MDKIHLAIIPDGNRRWAKAQSWLPWKGHETAVGNFQSIVDWCVKDGRVGTLTMWGFSTENWKRDEFEVSKLMELFEGFLRKESDNLVKEKIRFAHSGRRDRIPETLKQIIEVTEAKTAAFDGFTLHLAIDYGGKDEISRAVRKLGEVSAATEENIRAHVDHPELPDIDLIVRTSGEQRTSNFFLWQAAYAEWMFLTKHFPDLHGDDLGQCLTDFAKRSRRFGGS